MIKLRGHHLVCLHYYHGGGLTEAYAANLMQKVQQAKHGDSILIAGSADDICVSCPYLQKGLCQGKMAEEEEILKLDREALAFLDCRVGDKVLWTGIQHKVETAPLSWFESYCCGCTWAKYCDRGINRKS